MAPHPPEIDSDQDGLSDLGEFLAGTEPNNATSLLKLLSARARPDGAIQLAWSSAPGRLYRIWSSPDMLSWSPTGDWVKGLAGQTGAILPVPKGSVTGFFRVEVRP